jgi:phage terminase Nu1 subunit (DNA packaging protein)
VGSLNRDQRSYLVTTDEAALVTGVSRDLIHQWARRGYLTKHGNGHAALWDWRELAAIKAAQPGQRRRVA